MGPKPGGGTAGEGGGFSHHKIGQLGERYSKGGIVRGGMVRDYSCASEAR